MEKRTIESFFFLTLLVGVSVLVAFMFWPFFNALFLGGVLAFLLSGINERLATRLGSRTLAALITTIGSVVVILLPLGFFLWQAFQEATGLYTYIHGHTTPTALAQFIDMVGLRINAVAPWLSIDNASLTAGIRTGLTWVVGQTGTLFASLGGAILDSLVMLFVLFFFLRDHVALRRKAMDLSPLSDEHESQILKKVAKTIQATVRGKILLAFLQGIIAGIGFWIFGVPAPVLWGGAVLLASFVPTIGTGLVALPIIIYLFLTGPMTAAIGLMLWYFLIVSLVDNFLGPKLMAHGTHVHPLLVFLAVLGGIALFGPIGILVGPVVIALLHALFDIYLSIVGVHRLT